MNPENILAAEIHGDSVLQCIRIAERDMPKHLRSLAVFYDWLKISRETVLASEQVRSPLVANHETQIFQRLLERSGPGLLAPSATIY